MIKRKKELSVFIGGAMEIHNPANAEFVDRRDLRRKSTGHRRTYRKKPKRMDLRAD